MDLDDIFKQVETLLGPFYDRHGMPISFMRMGTLKWGSNPRQDVVARVDYGHIEISTVWLGQNLHPGTDPPLIFETMIFAPEGSLGWGRYPTETEALAGHTLAVGWARIHHPIPALTTPTSPQAPTPRKPQTPKSATT